MTLRIFAFFCLAISLMSVYFGNRNQDLSADFKHYENTLNTRYGEDSILIKKYFSSENDRAILSKLNNSPFFIEVFRNDSIIFWNDHAVIQSNPSEELLLLARLGDSLNYALVSLNLDKTRKNTFSANFYNPNFTLEIPGQTMLGSKFYVRSLKLDATFLERGYLKMLRIAAWICLMAGFLIASYVILEKIKAAINAGKILSKELVYLFLLFTSMAVLHLLPKFHIFFGLESVDLIALDAPNIYQMFCGLWIAGCLIYLFGLLFFNTEWFKRFSNFYCWFTGFYTFFIFGFSVFIIEKWITKAPVNLEIEALLEFNGLSFLVIISFFLLMVLVFQSTQLLYEWLHTTNVKGFNKVSLTATGWIGAFIVLKLLGWLNVPEWIFIIFVMAYTLILDAYTEKNDKKITYLIWWLMMFSGFLAVTLFYFGLKKDIEVRKEFISKYFTEYDSKIVKELERLNDSLVLSNIFNQIASLETPSKLDMEDLYDYIFVSSNRKTGYSIELFEKQSGITLFNNHFADYYKLNQSFVNARKAGKNIYHNPFENRYFSRFEIARSFPEIGSWYFFIIYHPHQQSPILNYDALPDFGYVIFNRDKLIEKKEGSQTPPEISQTKEIYETCINNGYSFVVSIPSDQYRVISWKKVSGLIKPISLFSFIFTLSGLILFILTLFNTKYDFLPINFYLKFGSRSSLKTKIQLAIILLIVVTFLIIGLITGMYFKNLIIANQKAKHIEEAESIINNINSNLQNVDDADYALNYISSKLKDLSYIHNKDLSLHDSSGKLLASTSGKNNLFRIPFGIWNTGVRQFEYIDSGTSTDIENQEYIPLYLGENYISREKPFAFLGIDHKTYNSSANILDFLSTILNAYIFLFLIAGAIAITIANSITQPLSILAEKLKKFKLGKTNELLEWKSNDEIGTLIHDYNNLTQELDRSAGLLAKTERDIAWREMAKQVAHEIKNPLTPMKLSIQYLDRAAKEHPDRAQELIPRISATLIEQIDNLSQIANEFSNFAAMPQASNEKVILNEIVETIHDLFRKRDDMEINLIEPIDDLYVFADKNHLVRILNNLLKNAIQAIPENRRGKIEIELKRIDNDANIRISDNGTGIPDYMKDKVFTPNFTTKSSGTGLGLAISANMIESFNGRIYFETKVGIGTDFFVSIPLMRLDDYFGDETRVSLE